MWPLRFDRDNNDLWPCNKFGGSYLDLTQGGFAILKKNRKNFEKSGIADGWTWKKPGVMTPAKDTF